MVTLYNAQVTEMHVTDTGGTERDITPYVKGVAGLPGPRNLLDATAYGDAGRKHQPDLEDVTVTLELMWSKDADVGADTVLGPLRVHDAAVALRYVLDTTIEYTADFRVRDYRIRGEVGGMVVATAVLAIEGGPVREEIVEEPDGDIGAIGDQLKIADDASFSKIVHHTGTIYAIAYFKVGGTLRVATVSIATDGTIGAILDDQQVVATLTDIEFDFVKVVAGSGIFAIVYAGADGDGFVQTIGINGSGTITSTSLATLEYDTANGNWPTIVQRSGDIYAIAYTGTGSNGYVRTVDISADGTSISGVDTQDLGVDGQRCHIVAVNGDIYAVFYGDGSNQGSVSTVDIDSSGAIGSVVASFTWGASGFDIYLQPGVVQVGDSGSTVYYAVIHLHFTIPGFSADVEITTVSISYDGTSIATVDNDALATGTGNTDPYGWGLGLGGTIYAFAWSGAGTDGYMGTAQITATGTISSIIETFEFDTSLGVYPHFLNVSGSVYAFTYGNGDLQLLTIPIT